MTKRTMIFDRKDNNYPYSMKHMKNVKIVSIDNNYPHWGWAVTWLLLFWPALVGYVYLGIKNKLYTIEFDYVENKHKTASIDLEDFILLGDLIE